MSAYSCGTAKGNSKTTNNAIADALLGNFRSYREADWNPVGFLRYTQSEAFAMDSWRVSRGLNLEIGLRYQHGIPTYAQANNMVNFEPRMYDPARAVTVTEDGFIVAGSGFLYNGLIRTGFGVFFNRPENSIVSSALSTPPYLRTVQVENGNLADPSGGTAAALSPMDSIYAVDPKLKTAYTMNFSLSVQRELPRGVFVEAAYVGNLGRHLQRAPDINQPTFEDYMALAKIPSASRPPVNSYRRYKGFSAIYMRLSDSNSNYNALQLYGAKRRGNLMMTASYTWSKALADASKNSEDPEDPFNRSFNYGPTTYDRRHIFVTT
jgi:hypothetical protein